MIELMVTQFDVAKLFGLKFISCDYADEDSCEYIYVYQMFDKEFKRSDDGYKKKDQMDRLMAEEVLSAIGRAATVKIN